MAAKVSITEFLNYYVPHAVLTDNKAPDNPPANQYGYVLGAQGDVATVSLINSLAKQNMSGSWQSYAARCAKWIGRQVFDCNSLAEAFYKRKTGTNIDTRALNNYASWCSVKDKREPDNQLAGMPQMPGVAVFMDTSGSESADGITHVGFLVNKYGAGNMDWYVLEARGADYGVVITRLRDRPWEWWGVMDKYFEYPNAPAAEQPATPATPAQPATSEPFFAECSGNSVNVRSERGTSNTIVGALYNRDKMIALPSVDGWCEIAAEYKGKIINGFMSDKYVKKVS